MQQETMNALRKERDEIKKNAALVAFMFVLMLLCGLHDWARESWSKILTLSDAALPFAENRTDNQGEKN